ncbi:WYL domain-containing protein [Brevibacterium linens]|uniref:WYL domain containing protein n=2 Tax=Brevibacterium TaxID=1696 RepID=A0A0B9A3W7_BRELN|nr:WYL domain-containing protein [Brevibacterium linens]KHS53519.1 WYL domain containing protein [Brevibacterium linens]HHX47835.1 WYL domain-containing protein [Brevibacterium sp.]HJE77482.1 WYL domain-containing protein [Brevibacterium epidermidis]
MSSARERLTRLLSLVPYLDAHPGADLEETAAYFGIDSDTLIDDLQLLFVTGRPGHMPDDLIDASWEGGQIFISNAEEVSVPVRLSAEEAGVLVLALDMLSSLPGLDSEAVATAASKLRVAAGENLRTAVDVSPIDADEELLSALRQSVEDGSALSIDYYVGSRDELTTRTIAPTRLVPGADWYVDAWCYSAGAPRRFALGRIRSWEPAAHPPMSVSEATTNSYEVTLGLAAGGAWLADELDVTNREYLDGGDTSVRIRLLVHSVDWLSRFLLCHADVITEIDDTEAVAAALRRLG